MFNCMFFFQFVKLDSNLYTSLFRGLQWLSILIINNCVFSRTKFIFLDFKNICLIFIRNIHFKYISFYMIQFFVITLFKYEIVVLLKVLTIKLHHKEDNMNITYEC